MERQHGIFPDRVYLHGRVITLAESQPQAEAVAVLGDKIAAVGQEAAIRELIGPNTVVEDLNGKTLVPGLNEPHNHFGMYGPMVMNSANLQSPPLGPIARMDDLISVLRRKAEEIPGNGWVTGRGYDDTLMAEKRHPTRHDLDKISADRPVFIAHVSGHFSVANTKALEMAGVKRETPQPVGGVIRRDPKTDEPDGVLEEMPAQMLVGRLIPPLTQEQRLKGLALASAHYLQAGVASCSDAGVNFPGMGSNQEIVAYQKAIQGGTLPLRITMMVGIHFLLGEGAQNSTFLTGFGDPRLKIGPAKVIVDGSIQGYTGWLSRPYHVPFKGDRTYCGYPVTPPEKLTPLILAAHKAGFQIAAHGNGDAAIDAILDAYELAQEKYPRMDVRHRIEHCQTVREDQLDRMAELGISPSFFVSHTFYWGDRHKNIFLGPDRAKRISPLKSALKRGIKFSVHSDCPVTPVSPLFCIFAAVNRVTRAGEILGSEFRLTPEEALRAVTTDAAWQTFDEKIKGSIEVGKLADFTILAENPLNVVPERIKDVKVEGVVIGGKRVFQAKG